jgi:hypothetical protein
MTSKHLTVPPLKGTKQMAEIAGIKGLVGRKMSKTVKFMGEDVKISKLSVAEVLDVQEKAKRIEGNDAESFNVLKTVIRSSVEGAKDLADEDFDGFALDELSKLSQEIMKFSGISQEQGK